MGLGDVLWVAGRFAEVPGEYQRALEVNPEYTDAEWRLAWFLANCQETRYRNTARAIELANSALRRSAWLNPQLWKTLGMACYRAGDWDGAIRALYRANPVGLGGSYEDFPMAMAHWHKGDKKKAQQYYARGCRWMQTYAHGFSKKPGYYWEDELIRLRAETAGLLGIEDPPAPPGDATPGRKNGP
jgi:tetratricopeptide (TPR) repeat protein